MLPFQTAAGSVQGRDHREAGRNNQDACVVVSHDDTLAIVVCDGCSGDGITYGRHNEFGAQFGARNIAEVAVQEDIQGLNRRLSFRLSLVHDMLGGSEEVLRDYLLFTVLGVLITPITTYLFACGDGVFYVNGTKFRLGPFPNNMPPYLAQGHSIEVVHQLPTAELEHLLVATDGLDDFEKAETRELPEKHAPLGHVSQFWMQPRYFRNSDMVRRTLALASRNGFLSDDTTLVALRRTS